LFFTINLPVSCIVDNEPTYPYTTAIRNVSDRPFHILILGDSLNSNVPVYDTLVNTIVNPNTYTFKKNYRETNFSGMVNKGNAPRPSYRYEFYYMKIVFLENGKGYICEKDSVNINAEFCFQYKVSLVDLYRQEDFL